MPSLKGLAVGVGAIIVVGYLALRTGAGKGLEGLATGITKTIASPLVGVGGGLKILGEGVSAFLSPTIAPTIAPKFDWGGWQPFGPTTGNGNAREEDRSPRPMTYTAPTLKTTLAIAPAILKRPEDRTAAPMGAYSFKGVVAL